MAKFEGVKWAPRQMRYLLPDKQFDILEPDGHPDQVLRDALLRAFLVAQPPVRGGGRMHDGAFGIGIFISGITVFSALCGLRIG